MNTNNLVIIHIGKCGGSTLLKELDLNKIKYELVHVAKVKYDPNKKYLIIIRNPIQRFISAFNWRYYLVCDSKIQENKYMNEKNILNKYNNIDKLCHELRVNKNIFNGSRNSYNYIHHLKEDINFYLEYFIDICPKDNLLGVICTETLKVDLKNIFNIDLNVHDKNNDKYKKNINNMNYKILKDYLHKDYLIIDKMYNKGWINDKQYLLLKK